MAYTPQQGDAQVSLSAFGGLVTNMPAAALPEGVSPACNDVAFLPGNVFSRAGLQKVFPAAFVNRLVYAKSFVTPLGGVTNLYLDSAGGLWSEDAVNSPGTAFQIGTVAPGSLGKSITAFGREYLAFSDGLHGTDIALQYDGTNLDRVTQEGPGAAPAVASISLPSVQMAGNGAPAAIVVTSCTPGNLDQFGDFTAFYVACAASIASISVGDLVTIAGSSVAFYNAGWTVSGVIPASNTLVINIAFPGATLPGAGGTVTPQGAVTMTRGNNIVTVYLASAIRLQVGFQVQITAVTAQTVGSSISSIVVNNENLPGVATVTTSAAHTLVPGNFVSISGVSAVTVGTSITHIVWAGGIATVTTTTAHGLSPGSTVGISGATNFNVGAVSVLSTPSTTTFTYAWTPIDTTKVADPAAGSVTLNWPIPATATPTYYEVLSAPTPTTFQVSLNYSDGTWTTGTVQFEWNGTFYVTTINAAGTSFQYQQYGPNGTTNVTGTATPWGQAAPGIHQCQVMFLTRQGHITAPSPPVKVVANGGQYFSVSNLPIGPSNIVARIIAFTGASGSQFFYIPAPAQINGQQVSTTTQIDDNTTTSVLLDFADATLFAATGVSIPGNNLAAQIVIDGALGFGLYADRLITWGQRNRIQNLLSMSFDGGRLGFGLTGVPLGWTVGSADDGAVGGSNLVAGGRFGTAWRIKITSANTPTGVLSQSFYQDAYGVAIGTPNQPYIFRAWFQTQSVNRTDATVTFTVTISSVSTGFSSTATVAGNLIGLAPGSWLQAAFGTAMPGSIPSDMLLTISAASTQNGPFQFMVDEMAIIYTDNPYLDTVMYGSYVADPEAFDGLTGKFGSLQDQHKIMDIADIRQTCYFLTQDPLGRLHEFSDNGVTEPAGWTVNQVAANCGLLSAFALTKSQADDASAAGGEEWFAWASYIGARIFGGSEPWEISREIAPTWRASLVPAFYTTMWALNDPASRTMYFSQQPFQQIFTLNYVGLDNAAAIGTTGPIRIGYSGKLIATDHSRKWAPWNVHMSGAALMYRGGALVPVLFGGNAGPGGNAYTLESTKYTDDDWGQIGSSYTTYFMLSHDQEQAEKLAGYRKLLTYVAAFISGVGNLTASPYVDNITNPWPITATRPLVVNPAYDIEFGGCAAQGNRIALRFSSSPLQGQTDNYFSLQRLTAYMRKAARLPFRGAA